MCDIALRALDRRLVDRLLHLNPAPRTLLEMGCGEGRKLLALKHGHDMEVCGVDTYEPSLCALKDAGVDARACDMRQLPFDDDAFDWVLIANSLHHVTNPGDALKEGARVARHGLVICEPWLDHTIASQRTTHALCEWSNSLLQSFGYFHRTGLSAGEVLELIDFNVASAEIHHELDIARWDVQQWLKDLAPWIAKLSPDHYLRWRLNQLLNTLPIATSTQPGQVTVVIRKAQTRATALSS
jgi:ubiquinone/menaquinone biosynthesis C-methylase UbiE